MDVMIRKVRSVLLYRRGRARMVQSSSDREGASAPHVAFTHWSRSERLCPRACVWCWLAERLSLKKIKNTLS